jgi:hypothetical protein
MSSQEKHLAWFLRFTAVIFLCAAPAVVMPTAWMHAINDWLGLGPLPEAPLLQYLARSMSALYVTMGGSYWFMSNDVRRYLPLLRFTVPVMVGFAVTVTIVDVQVAMPIQWTAGAALSLAGWTLALWWLVRRIKEPRTQ